MRCGHEIIIGGNFMLSEINGEELNEEDDAMVTNAHCPYCGAGYELYDTPESEKKKTIHIGEYSGISPHAYTVQKG